MTAERSEDKREITNVAPVLRGCQNIGPFGYCEISGCSANLGGPCALRLHPVTTDAGTEEIV